MASPVPGPASAAEKVGLYEDFVDIFAAPSAVFARRATSGAGAAFLIVWIVLSLVTFSGRSVMAPIVDAQMARSEAAMLKQNPNVTPEQLEMGRRIGRTITGVGSFIMPPIVIAVLGLLTWLVGQSVGARLSASAGIMIATYAYIPRIIGGLAVDVQGLFLDTSVLTDMSQISIGPARFFDAATTGATTLTLLNRVDVFTLWVTVLLALGIAAVGKVPKGKAALAGAVLWVLGGLFPLWGAMRAGG